VLVCLLALPPFHVCAGEAGPNPAAEPRAAETPEQPPNTMPNFDMCVDRLLADAEAAGVSAATRKRARSIIREDRSVLKLDQTQPEFTNTFAGYFPVRVTNSRVSEGRALLLKHQDLLERIQRETGVPPQYLLSFWGLETDFGKTLGDRSVPASLANLACDSRRSDFFRQEFLNALLIVDRGDSTVEGLTGSWAGAMGNMQFMPSAWLQHAADGDGDGKRDLWNSTTDALVSASRFLAALGWQTGMRWGREVLLPDGFDYLMLDQIRPLATWSGMGRPLKVSQTPARIILPSGAEGPAFIAYPNFDVIMKWNRSEYYAISVGRLADQIAGGGKLVRPIPDNAPKRLPLQTTQTLQRNLAARGFDVGAIDGLIGPGTRRAIAAFQQSHGWPPHGFTDPRTLAALTTSATSVAPVAPVAPVSTTP
jgi:membrane-bound lytic murein transglycosylase B